MEFTEGSINVVVTNTKVFDLSGSGSNSQSGLFSFEHDLIVTSATATKTRLNVGASNTFTGLLYYYGTSTPPANVSGITGKIENSTHALKGSTTTINSTGHFAISFNVPSAVGNYTYILFATTTQNTVQNKTVWCIADNIVVSSKGGARGNINTYQQCWFTLRSQYDSASITSGTVTLNGTLSASWISARSRWEYNISESSVQQLSLYVASINWSGITSLSSQTSNSTSVIWDNIVVSSKGTTSSRCNINTYQQFYCTLRSQYDSSAVTSGTVTLNGSVSASWIPARSRWEYNVTHSSPSKYTYYVASITWNSVTSLSSQTSNSTSVIWDNLVISNKGVTAPRINTGLYKQFWFTLRSQYDSSSIQTGTVTLNGSLSAPWVSARSRWEYNVSKSSPQKLSLYVVSVNWSGVTSLSSQTSNSTSVIWDKLLITYASDSTNPIVGQTVSFTVTAKYAYDNASVTFSYININRNGSYFASGPFTDMQTNNIAYLYTTKNASDVTYGITVFSSNTLTVSWEPVPPISFGIIGGIPAPTTSASGRPTPTSPLPFNVFILIVVCLLVIVCLLGFILLKKD